MIRGLLLFVLLLATVAAADEVRDANLKLLTDKGFRVAPSLPIDRHSKLRPQDEIEHRLDALISLVLWVTAPPGVLDDEALKKKALSGTLSSWLTEDEKAIFKLDKATARAEHIDTIGWQMENVWGLAWVLGYNIAPPLQGQLEGEQARDLILGFGVEGERRLRPVEEVVKMEDLFYCAHNAVRSAQLGGDTVPDGFDPMGDGGCIHERRHALTWCLSPGVDWEDTDLST
jgi:hypothetical protein